MTACTVYWIMYVNTVMPKPCCDCDQAVVDILIHVDDTHYLFDAVRMVQYRAEGEHSCIIKEGLLGHFKIR